MSKGIIFDVQHFCVGDGPGIRTTVFFKGCPLRCIWCHNAEGLQGGRQLSYTARKCIGCGECVAVCPSGCHSFRDSSHAVDTSACVLCGKCAEECPSSALKTVGRTVRVEEVIKEIKSDKPFYKNSGGGVTLSGGEPLMQADFAEALAKECKKEGVSLCIETCGYCKREDILRLAPYTDTFLFDFKHYSPQKHREYTGVDNGLILENLRLLHKLNKPVILRCPIIPGCNDCREHYSAIAELANSMSNVREIHIEPYHPLGVDKYPPLGMTALYQNEEMMPAAEAEKVARTLQSMTQTPVIIS